MQGWDDVWSTEHKEELVDNPVCFSVMEKLGRLHKHCRHKSLVVEKTPVGCETQVLSQHQDCGSGSVKKKPLWHNSLQQMKER